MIIMIYGAPRSVGRANVVARPQSRTGDVSHTGDARGACSIISNVSSDIFYAKLGPAGIFRPQSVK